jgi:hypothetical protein
MHRSEKTAYPITSSARRTPRYLFVTSGGYYASHGEGQMKTLPENPFQEISREKRKDSIFVLLGIIALAWIIMFIIS